MKRQVGSSECALCMRWRLPVLAGVVCSLAAVPLGGAMSEPAAAAPPVLLELPGPLFPMVDFSPSCVGMCSEVLAHGGQFHGGERFLTFVSIHLKIGFATARAPSYATWGGGLRPGLPLPKAPPSRGPSAECHPCGAIASCGIASRKPVGP
jgi:hypothetical protein